MHIWRSAASSWRNQQRVLLEVADTKDAALIGKKSEGEIVEVYGATLSRPEAALVRLNTPLADASTVLMVRRGRPTLLRREVFVHVVPWSKTVPPDVEQIDLWKETAFIAEVKKI